MTSNYTIKGQWLVTPYGRTMHWTKSDLAWLDDGNIPYVTKGGFITLPYGNTNGHDTYKGAK